MSSTYINSVVIQEPMDTDSLMAFNNAQTLELRSEDGGDEGVLMTIRQPSSRYAGELVIGGEWNTLLLNSHYCGT